MVIATGILSETVSSTILDDCVDKGDHTFTITINSVSIGTIGTGTKTVTIANDDGVGPAGDNCDLDLWFDAGKGVSAVSGQVQTWGDQSSNTHDESADGSNRRPTYVSSSSDTSFNFLPYLSFDGGSDRLGVNSSYISSTSIDAVYGFVVFRTDALGRSYNSNWALFNTFANNLYEKGRK